MANTGFLIKAEDLDLFFDELKEFANRFQYWKYFEDTEGVLAQLVQPKVTMSPLSAHAYLTKILKLDPSLQDNNKDQRKNWTFVEPKTSLDI